MPSSDVLVIGKGNAALCAALAARDGSATVTILEAASEEESGGNSAFAGGVMRFAFDGVDDLKRIIDLTPEEIASSDFGINTRDEYFDDLFSAPELCSGWLFRLCRIGEGRAARPRRHYRRSGRGCDVVSNF
jgi:glycine/D-amino acid oxidase-like deaminating enzyme